jgi:hypothetical protein
MTGYVPPPKPPTPFAPTSLADLMTPPGVIHTVQGAASSIASVVPAPEAGLPGAPGAAIAGVPPAANPVTPWLASGVSQLLSPPPLNLPSVPGVGIPLPSKVPVPSDLLCAGTDWSVSQGDHGAQPPVQQAVNGRDRWATQGEE